MRGLLFLIGENIRQDFVPAIGAPVNAGRRNSTHRSSVLARRPFPRAPPRVAPDCWLALLPRECAVNRAEPLGFCWVLGGRWHVCRRSFSHLRSTVGSRRGL